jgi:hypothetical protein
MTAAPAAAMLVPRCGALDAEPKCVCLPCSRLTSSVFEDVDPDW